MQQLSSACPHCGFVLQFYDASLFGRRGKCPKCRNKFVLERPDPDKPETVLLSEDTPPGKVERVASGGSRAVAPAAKKPLRPARPKPAAAGKTSEKEAAWEMNLNRGLGTGRPTLSPRWIFPNVFALSTLLVIGVGAATGMGAASQLLEVCPPSILAAASAAGAAIGAGFLIRRYDPSQPKT